MISLALSYALEVYLIEGVNKSCVPAKDIDTYLEPVEPLKRAALQKLRAQLHSLLPEATECISYGLPAFRVQGKVVLGFGAASKHCAFYPWSSNVVGQFVEELKPFGTSKGAVRFQPDKPLPLALLKKLVKARVKEHAASVSSKS